MLQCFDVSVTIINYILYYSHYVRTMYRCECSECGRRYLIDNGRETNFTECTLLERTVGVNRAQDFNHNSY